MNTDVISTYTRIYVGGGNFLTQSHPTHFHTFTTSRILSPDESPAHYREVTPEERQQIEAADAAWTRPPQAFIDAFCAAAGSPEAWSESTGYFKHHGFNDIDYPEALEMMRCRMTSTAMDECWHYLNARTHLPVRSQWIASANRLCQGNAAIELVDLNLLAINSTPSQMFYECPRLHTVWLGNQIRDFNKDNFHGCPSLRNVFLRLRTGKADLSEVEALTPESIDYAIDNKTENNNVTLRIHPAAFARLTDDQLARAAAVKLTIAT